MPPRKVWVRRPNAVPTQVAVKDDDLVDDIKDMILRKYANSIGRSFDSPDVVLKLTAAPSSARHSNDRILGPDENIAKFLDAHFPGGQSMDEALTIDVPHRRTPKHSPRPTMAYFTPDDLRPGESAGDYFPPMPITGLHSPHLVQTVAANGAHTVHHRPLVHPHSITVLETGQVPNLPSPGSGRPRHSDRAARPRFGRQHTASPTVMTGAFSIAHDVHKPQAQPALPTPPAEIPNRTSTPPPARTVSPRPGAKSKRARRTTNGNADTSSPFGRLEGPPPINVLIVEDNIINLKLLEAFLKRLKVRWSTAMNGKIAVDKWRQGGFHLVLMDIQLPVMNGLDATKEIRRLERVNKIGVFANGAGCNTNAFGDEAGEGMTLDMASEEQTEETAEAAKAAYERDNLTNTALFKSPVIIVALTASSLQSDRHEALAAGCNDFLTKPVNFDWLSRKVMEWGCMQALIDFDGWRKWKDFSSMAVKPVDKKAVTTKSESSNSTKPNTDIATGKGPNSIAAIEMKRIISSDIREEAISSSDGG